MQTVASEPPDSNRAYRQRVEDVIAALASDGQHGLSEDAARSGLERHGANELASERPIPAWRRFLRQFQDVLVILLLGATAISAGLWAFERDAAWPYEAIAIFAVVLLNAALGYIAGIESGGGHRRASRDVGGSRHRDPRRTSAQHLGNRDRARRHRSR